MSKRWLATSKGVGNWMNDPYTSGAYHPTYADLVPKDIQAKRPKGVKAKFIDAYTSPLLVRYVIDLADFK